MSITRQLNQLQEVDLELESSEQALARAVAQIGESLVVLETRQALERETAGLEELRPKIYQVLDIIRVYTKAPGKKPELDDPIILARGSTLADAAADVHKDFAAKMKYARIWGSGKHDGVMAKRDHILQDGDIIELHL